MAELLEVFDLEVVELDVCDFFDVDDDLEDVVPLPWLELELVDEEPEVWDVVVALEEVLEWLLEEVFE